MMSVLMYVFTCTSKVAGDFTKLKKLNLLQESSLSYGLHACKNLNTWDIFVC